MLSPTPTAAMRPLRQRNAESKSPALRKTKRPLPNSKIGSHVFNPALSNNDVFAAASRRQHHVCRMASLGFYVADRAGNLLRLQAAYLARRGNQSRFSM